VARKLAAKNIDLLLEEKFDAIITDCSSCASFLKKYPAIFADDDRQGKAEKTASRLRDMVELIFSNGPPVEIEHDPVVVTYHDPCHASRGQKISREPREILKKIPGVEYRELPEADWCCGGAGSYALSHYDLSQRVLDRKMENLKKTGADMLVTSCPACMIQLSYGIRRHGLKTKVCHISQVVTGIAR
jgi:glycolate oxidase iron-sulfur subunit